MGRTVKQRAEPKPSYARPHGVMLCGFCVTDDCDLCPGQIRNGTENKKHPTWDCPCWLKDPGRHTHARLLNLELDLGGANGSALSSPVPADNRRRGKRR
jgi:hypothetical protein